MCKNFSSEILSEKYDTDTKFTFNNDYINYFEDSESYDINSFTDYIFKDESIKKDFFEYQESNKESFDFNINDKFNYHRLILKKKKRKLKILSD